MVMMRERENWNLLYFSLPLSSSEMGRDFGRTACQSDGAHSSAATLAAFAERGGRGFSLPPPFLFHAPPQEEKKKHRIALEDRVLWICLGI